MPKDTIETRIIHKKCQEFLDSFGWNITHIRYGLYGDEIDDHKSFHCIAERNGAVNKLYCCIGEDRIYGVTGSIPGYGCYRLEDDHLFKKDPEYIKEKMPAYVEVNNAN